MRICTVTDCDRKHFGRGYCQRHLARLTRTGSTSNPPARGRQCHAEACERRIERINKTGFCRQHHLEAMADPWSRIEVTGACWLWRGQTTSRGYGLFQSRGLKLKAHRVVFERLVGPIREGLVLDHLCRIRRCVNPDHLQPVTQTENVLRMHMRQQHSTTLIAA